MPFAEENTEITCPQCEHINTPGVEYCVMCNDPLTVKAKAKSAYEGSLMRYHYARREHPEINHPKPEPIKLTEAEAKEIAERVAKEFNRST